MKKILVTGGAGYIGSHTVVELIGAGYQPVIVDNLSNSNAKVLDALRTLTQIDIPFHLADCADLDALRLVFDQEKDIDGVIHFAAFKAVGESVRDPFKYYHNNINSTLNVLQLMQEFEVKKLVFSSSCTVYGQPEQLPVNEETPLAKAASPYGYTKQICEVMIQDFTTANADLHSVILRYFNPTGAHPSALIGELPIGKPENLVPFITQTAAGIRDGLTIFGNDYNTPDGTCIRDYIHVVDLAKAHVKSLDWMEKNENPSQAEIINLGLGHGYSVQEVVDAFKEVTGLPLNHQYGPRRSGDVEQIYSSCLKAEKLLNWKCQYDLKDMIKHSWAWQQSLK